MTPNRSSIWLASSLTADAHRRAEQDRRVQATTDSRSEGRSIAARPRSARRPWLARLFGQSADRRAGGSLLG
jgi:hypothetical protein